MRQRCDNHTLKIGTYIALYVVSFNNFPLCFIARYRLLNRVFNDLRPNKMLYLQLPEAYFSTSGVEI